MKRKIVNKPKTVVCGICLKPFSLYGMVSHIKNTHHISLEQYTNTYGEFRAPIRQSKRNIQTIQCGICGRGISSTGMFVHLRDSHDISPDDYVKLHPEYRPSKIRQQSYMQRLKENCNIQTCVICGKDFPSGNLLGWHIKNEHKISKREYILTHIFNGTHPKCKCGCGRPVKILNYYPYCREYISSHNPNAMLGKHHSNLSKEKMALKAMERLSATPSPKIDTEPEKKFEEFLNRNNEKYIHPYKTEHGLIDFFLPDRNWFVEIDGNYWHPIKIEGLNFRLLPNVISAKRKSSLPNLKRIREENIDKIKSIADIQTLSTTYDFIIPFRQKIIFKEFFEACLELKGESYLHENIWLLLKFIREMQPEFPFPPNEETPGDVITQIQSADFKSILNENERTFSNNISNIGVSWLKSHFKSYWKSAFNGNPSPVEAWGDDEILKQIITYRVGLNNSGEIFDFSLHQMIRGLSARRLTVSFFKPLLAAAIYDYYLKDATTPTTFDPCCGFGGRLVGFKARYPHGKYIGCEPNSETYTELVSLVRMMNWQDVQIYNCKQEDFKETITPDFVFTSIPYYDKEIYSQPVEYSSFEKWTTEFIGGLLRHAKLAPTYINLSQDLAQLLGWNNPDTYIVSNRSHFDRTEGLKIEPIVKL